MCSTSLLRPRGLLGGSNGSIIVHSRSLMSEGYAFLTVSIHLLLLTPLLLQSTRPHK